MTAIVAAAALAIGVVLGWLLVTGRVRTAERRVEDELRYQAAEKDAAIASLRNSEVTLIADRSTALAALASSEQQLMEARGQVQDCIAKVASLQSTVQEQAAALAQARAECAAARASLEERDRLYASQTQEVKETQAKAIADLREAFKALSAEALSQNAPEFLRLAKESFANLQETAKGDLSQRQEAIAGLLKPLEEQLRTYQTRLQQTESAQTTVLGEVKEKLESLTRRSESLANETERFRMVLKSSQTRGRWGEETLRRVVEAAGMSVHCDFAEQATGDEGRPDMVVNLPGNRIIIVDAKVPDLDFITALETADLQQREQALQAHARKLKDTIRILASRDYPSQFANALDHVVLFLPAESLFSAALEGDRELLVWAASNRVMLATPASLIALLRSVSVSWQQFEQNENARAILEAARELYGRVTVFLGHFEKIRAGLNRATEAFNASVGSLDHSVRPSGERLLRLGLDAGGKQMVEIAPLDTVLRLPEGGSPAQVEPD